MNATPSHRVAFLGSGSAGNAAAITSGDDILLIDCGLSAREVCTRMRDIGLDPARVSAILVTHEHSDHIRGIDVFVRRHADECVVYGTERTLRRVRHGAPTVECAQLRKGTAHHVGPFTVLPFRTSHDAEDPVGYRIEGPGFSAGIATDTGVLTGEAVEALQGVEILGLESNHDPDMLDRGPYPPHLKRRILSELGHLSNADACAGLERLASDALRCVVGLHRSTTNNTHEHAHQALAQRIGTLGLTTRVAVARQSQVCEVPRTG